MARTLLQLTVHTLQQAGLGIEDQTVDASGNSTTTARCAALKRYSDNKFNGWHMYVDGGSPSTRQLIVTDFGQSNGELTFQPALGAAPDSLAFLLSPWNRTNVVDAIVDAVLQLHETGHLVRQLELKGIVGGSPLYNAGFDYWSSSTVCDGWVRNGSGTVARERASANIWASAQSLKLSTAADYIKLDEPYKRFLEDLRGETVRFYCPVKTATASIARINLNDGSDHYSSYHSGGGQWEILDTGLVTVATSGNTPEPRLYNDGTAAVYFADPWIETSLGIIRDYPYPFPYVTRIANIEMTDKAQPISTAEGPSRHMGQGRGLNGWSQIEHYDEAATTATGLIRFNSQVPLAGHRLRIQGSGPLSVPSADSDNVEIDYTESLMVANLAAAILLERKAAETPDVDRDRYQEQAARCRRNVQQAVRGYGHAAQAAQLPRRF